MPSTAYTVFSIHRVQHPLSTAYTKYSIHWVQHTLSIAYTEYSIHRLQLILSTAYTDYGIHQVQHTPTTAYTEYSIHWLLNYPCKSFWFPFIITIVSWPLNVASGCCIPPYKIDCHQPVLQESSKVKSPCHSPTVLSQVAVQWSLISTRCISLWAALSIFLITLQHDVQVYLQACSITALKFISKLAPSLPQSESLWWLDHGHQLFITTDLVTASKFAQSWPSSASPTHLIMAAGSISKFTWSWPRSVLTNSLNYCLQVDMIMALQRHLQTSLTMASKFAWFMPASAFPNDFSPQSPSTCISLLHHHLQVHSESLWSTNCSQSRYAMCRWLAIYIHRYMNT